MRFITVKNLKKVIVEEKAVETLKDEILRVFGPVVNYSPRLERMVQEANDRLEVLERIGRLKNLNFKPSLLLKFSNHPNVEIRTFVAKTLPSSMLERFMYDVSPSVRHAAAKRLPISKLNEMSSYYSTDDALFEIKRIRLMTEAKDVVVSRGQLLKGKVKQDPGPDLSPAWYTSQAHKAISDYNGNVEGMWDEIWSLRYCKSIKDTTGIECDHEKLWAEIQKQLLEKDDNALRVDDLKSLAKSLKESAEWEEKQDDDKKVDEINEILSLRISHSDRVNRCMKIFKIKESQLPPTFIRSRISEGLMPSLSVPCKGTLPQGARFTSKIEKVLDAFENSWNKLQESAGENLRIRWSTDPMSETGFVFAWEIK